MFLSFIVLIEIELDLSFWQPLIENRQFVSWLVNIPTKEEKTRVRNITPRQMQQREAFWKSEIYFSVEKTKKTAKPTFNTVIFQFDNANQYQDVFAPLVKLEADYDKMLKDFRKKIIDVRWKFALNRDCAALFRFPQKYNDIRLIPGDKLCLRLMSLLQWIGTGQITGVTDREEIKLVMKQGQFIPTNQNKKFVVEYVWKPVNYVRMQEALKLFARDEKNVSKYIYHRILGHVLQPQFFKILIPENIFNAPGLPLLKHSQREIFIAVLNQPISLIQGPPGTGKTITSTNIVFYMSHKASGQVLICAPSNVAVDQLAFKIGETGCKLIRITPISKETIHSYFKHFDFHCQVHDSNLPGKLAKKFCSFRKFRNLQRELNEKDKERFKSLKQALKRKFLQLTDIICCTCSIASEVLIRKFSFCYVLLDETTQACEPETLIPIVHGTKQLVLVGDYHQLGPVVIDQKAVAAGFKQSMFERLVFTGIKPYRLKIQYRMHPCLTVFPSNTFYYGMLQNGIRIVERTIDKHVFPWPNPTKPMIFHANYGIEETSVSGTSYLNRAEAAKVETIVTLLLYNGISPLQIGVVTPYNGQRAHIMLVMQHIGSMNQQLYQDVEVASINAFQGREKDYIVLSCVRSNDNQEIGFLSDSRRLNVALTRARYGLILIGNPKLLSREHLWNYLLLYYRNQGCLVEGSITNFKTSFVVFSKPKKNLNIAGSSHVRF